MKKLLPVLCALTLLLPATGLSQNTDKNQSGLSQNSNQSNKNQRAKEAMAAANASKEEAQKAKKAEEVKNANPQIKGQSGSDLSHSLGYSNAAANAGNSEAALENANRAWYDTPEARKKTASTSGGDWTSKISSRDIDNDPGLTTEEKDQLKRALADAREISAQIKKNKEKLEGKKEYKKKLEGMKEKYSNDSRVDLTLVNQYIEETEKKITELNESIRDKQTKLDGIKRRLRACTNCKPALQ